MKSSTFELGLIETIVQYKNKPTKKLNKYYRNSLKSALAQDKVRGDLKELRFDLSLSLFPGPHPCQLTNKEALTVLCSVEK